MILRIDVDPRTMDCLVMIDKMVIQFFQIYFILTCVMRLHKILC